MPKLHAPARRHTPRIDRLLYNQIVISARPKHGLRGCHGACLAAIQTPRMKFGKRLNGSHGAKEV